MQMKPAFTLLFSGRDLDQTVISTIVLISKCLQMISPKNNYVISIIGFMLPDSPAVIGTEREHVPEPDSPQMNGLSLSGSVCVPCKFCSQRAGPQRER